MKENEYPFVEFCKCIDQIEQAEYIHDLKSMRFYIKKAETYPLTAGWENLQKWLQSYVKLIYQLLYDNKPDKEAKAEAVQALLKLRKKAIYKPKTAEEKLASLYEYVKYNYARMLLILLKEDSQEMLLPEYEELCLELLEIMEKEKWGLLTGRDYYSMIHLITAEYYIRKKQIISGQYYYQKVWERYREKETISAACFQVLCSYLNNLVVQGELDEALKVRLFINERFWNGQVEDCDKKELENTLPIFFYQTISLFECTNRQEMIPELLETLFNEKFFNKKICNIHTLLLYLQYLIKLNEENKSCSKKRQKEIKSYLKKIEKNTNFINASDHKTLIYFMAQYLLLKMKKSNKSADCLRKCKEVLQNSRFDEFNKQQFLGGVRFVIMEYKSLGQSDKILECAECFIKKTVNFYSVREFYEENEQMEKYFEICDIAFQCVYYSVKDILSIEKKFVYSLNYKRILSSVLRLRNQKNIKGADLQEFPYFSLEHLKEILPERTAIIDFLYIEPEIYETGRRFYESPNRRYVLDIFVLSKKNGIYTVEYKSISEAEQLNKKLTLLMDKIKKNQGKMRELSKQIYRELFEDFESLFQGINQFWICPDWLLCNFSFDAFFELADSDLALCNIVHWQSFRDVFEKWQAESGRTASCMIGSPKFELKDKKKNPAREEMELSLLPYSGYEVVKLAEYMDGDCFIGEKAFKSALKQGYQYIHIATHSFNRDEEKNPWYKSVLAFSGAQDYLNEGQEITGYGNGLLSAEEISKMDFIGTELVVLSACGSGNSFFSDHRQQSGLHAAFGVSGVKYIISALWEVDDFPTAVFMSYFYENLKKKISVPEALFLAKQMLKKTTVKELRELIIRDREIMPESCKELLVMFENLPEEYCCYDSVRYWGSFICSQAMR